jgi:ATP-binding cassette, subfamily C (CFTR/MRP), member 1
MLRCSGDDSFGPALGPDFTGCYNFDFTLLFEDAIFSTAPCALVLPLAALRLHALLRRPASVHWAFLGALKLVGWTCACKTPSSEY